MKQGFIIIKMSNSSSNTILLHKEVNLQIRPIRIRKNRTFYGDSQNSIKSRNNLSEPLSLQLDPLFENRRNIICIRSMIFYEKKLRSTVPHNYLLFFLTLIELRTFITKSDCSHLLINFCSTSCTAVVASTVDFTYAFIFLSFIYFIIL